MTFLFCIEQRKLTIRDIILSQARLAGKVTQRKLARLISTEEKIAGSWENEKRFPLCLAHILQKNQGELGFPEKEVVLPNTQSLIWQDLVARLIQDVSEIFYNDFEGVIMFLTLLFWIILLHGIVSLLIWGTTRRRYLTFSLLNKRRHDEQTEKELYRITLQASLLRPWYPLPPLEQEQALCQKYVTILANAYNAQVIYSHSLLYVQAGVGEHPSIIQEQTKDSLQHPLIHSFATRPCIQFPLEFQNQHYGICVLSFPPTHVFGKDEHLALLTVLSQWASNLTMLRTLAQEQREVKRLSEKLALLQKQAFSLSFLPPALLLEEIRRLTQEISSKVPPG